MKTKRVQPFLAAWLLGLMRVSNASELSDRGIPPSTFTPDIVKTDVAKIALTFKYEAGS